MKWQLDEMATWWNGNLMKWQIDLMATWWNGKLMKWQIDEMANWWNGVAPEKDERKCKKPIGETSTQKMSPLI